MPAGSVFGDLSNRGQANREENREGYADEEGHETVYAFLDFEY